MTAIYRLKVLNVQVPQLFKDVIDALNLDVSSTSTVWVVAGSLILGCAYPPSSHAHLTPSQMAPLASAPLYSANS